MTKDEYKEYLKAKNVVCFYCYMDEVYNSACMSCPVRIVSDNLKPNFGTKLDMILDKLDGQYFEIHEYEEHNKLCGYEMEAYTANGVNMIHFIDCRIYPDGITADNVMCQLREISSEFDVDNEIHKLMYDKEARAAFSYRDAVYDMEAYADRLRSVVCEIQEELDKWERLYS